MADLVNIIIGGRDESGPAFKSASTNAKQLSGELKGARQAFQQFGNVASQLGGEGTRTVIGGLESAAAIVRELGKDAIASRTALLGVAAAATAGGYAIGTQLRQFIPFFNEDIILEKAVALQAEIRKITNQTIAFTDAERASIANFNEDIETRIQGLERLGVKTREQEELVFQLRRLQAAGNEAFQEGQVKAEEEKIKSVNKLLIDWQQQKEKINNPDTASFLDVEVEHKRRIEMINEMDIAEEEGSRLIVKSWELMEAERTKLARDWSEKRGAILTKERKDALMQQSVMLSGYASIIGSFSQIAAAFGKKNFALTQALRYAEAVVNVAAGIARAYATYDFPVSAVVAATVAAAGAAQIATIASTKANVAHGGLDYVPSESTFLLQRGERVVQPRQNVQLTEFLEDQRSGGAVSSGASSGDVYLDGDRVGRVLWRMSRNGQLSISAKAVSTS
jgi:hypothetical protein